MSTHVVAAIDEHVAARLCTADIIFSSGESGYDKVGRFVTGAKFIHTFPSICGGDARLKANRSFVMPQQIYEVRDLEYVGQLRGPS